MSSARRRPVTYDDLAKVPEHMVAEIIGGELVTSPRPASPHALAAAGILRDLAGFHGPPGGPARPGGWWILMEPELHLGADVLVPDIAGWRHERMAAVPNVAAFELAPDWVCEVVSPSTAQIDRARKMQIYARESVGHLWLVDPLARTIEAYRLRAGQWIVASTHGGSEPIRAEPFDGVEIDPARWWLEP
jgi:Uma2 family endonuclease